MSAYLGALTAVFLLLHLAFLLAVHFRRNDIADTAWGLGFIAATLGALLFLMQQSPNFELGGNEMVLLFCVLVWAGRLAQHIGLRTWSHPEEDMRYQKLRRSWGSNWKTQSYLKVFLLQGVLIIFVALPVIQGLDDAPHSFSLRSFLGFLIWIVGFAFEALSDHQLKVFKSDLRNRGKIMDRGLWAWSRHPNYFGEVVQWWGIFVLGCSEISSIWTVLSPILMTFLILKVSGVPMLEELMENRPGFSEYKKRTAIFFPRRPRI